jgi:hypothetical protein
MHSKHVTPKLKIMEGNYLHLENKQGNSVQNNKNEKKTTRNSND